MRPGNLYWISGYQGHQPDIGGLLNGYQEKIDQISVKYLDIIRYQVECSQRVINLKNS